MHCTSSSIGIFLFWFSCFWSILSSPSCCRIPLTLSISDLGPCSQKAGFQFALPNDWHISFVITTVSFVVSLAGPKRAAFLKKSTGLVATVSGFLGGVLISVLTWIICGFVFGWDKPEVQRFAIEGGGSLSPEFLALWFGLTFFTSAAIAEIFRAGFLAVPKGQWAAASALGMTKQKSSVISSSPSTKISRPSSGQPIHELD